MNEFAHHAQYLITSFVYAIKKIYIGGMINKKDVSKCCNKISKKDKILTVVNLKYKRGLSILHNAYTWDLLESLP